MNMAKKQEKPTTKRKPAKPKAKIVHPVIKPELGKEIALQVDNPKQYNQVEVLTKKKIEDWLRVTGKVKELNEDEVEQFIEISQAFGLNPFKREIHVNLYSKNDPSKRAIAIVIGYEVYLKRAERIRTLDGWKCWTTGEKTEELIAHIQIWRKDRKQPFEWEVSFREATQNNTFWQKMPKMMLKKVCISQGFRLCFPDDLGGMPFTDAESVPNEYEDQPGIEGTKEPIYTPKSDVEDAITEPVADEVMDNATALKAAVRALNEYSNKSIIASVGRVMNENKTSTAKLEVFTAWVSSAKKQKTIASIDLLAEILRKPEEDMAVELKKIKEE
jgi:phage recombination protein Bet